MSEVLRKKRHLRIRKYLKGTREKPRLVVFRSNKHIYTQLINDKENVTITSCSTLSKEFKSLGIKTTTKDAAYHVGKLIAKKALDLGIKEVCFDRAGYKYHGKVKALADGAREGGLKF
ncbi:MAG: 50S ribosomal protein L18 [Candidatus Omnitrophica bacterium]|nr:50S ribosomal protein L18 [Candidatus Omnitrophota bacterium]